MSKSAVMLINNSKNKLNSEIIFIFYPNLNAHIIANYNLDFVIMKWMSLILLSYL